MRALVDTNVIPDLLPERRPFYRDAYIINELVEQRQIEGCITSSEMTDIFYIARRKIKDISQLYSMMDEPAQDYTITPVHSGTITAALALRRNDFEDAVQYVAAGEACAACIVTRDCGFETGAIPCIAPETFLARLAAQRAARR